MRILVDENMASQRLVARIQAAGHDAIRAIDAGLLSATDPRVFAWAIGAGRCVLTRDYDDFLDLHELILACGGRHHGLLIVRFDSDPRHNLTDQGIVTALGKLELSQAPLTDQVHVLNHWR